MAYRSTVAPTRELIYVSSGVRELTGWTAEAFVSGRTSWHAIIHPEDVVAVEHEVEAAQRERRGFSLVHRIVHASGSVRWVTDRGRLVDDDPGGQLAFEGFVSDVTELTGINVEATALRRSEQARRASDERFGTVFEHAATGIAIMDLHRRFERCNPALTTLLGYSEAELQHIELASMIHPDDRAANLEQFRRLGAGEVASFEIENRYLRKDGAEIWVRKSVSVLRDDAGAPAHLMVLVTDITDQRRAEQVLRASEARLRDIIDAMFTFVGVLEPDGTLVETNRAPVELMGLNRDDVLGKKFWDCPWWSYDQGVQTRIRAAVERAAGGEVVRCDETMWVPNDGRMVVDFQLQPVFEGGRVRMLIPSGVDITDRKRAEDALKDSDRRKDEFLATLAHELRNPLAPLRTGIDVMKAVGDPAVHERAREMMERQLEHMVRLIDDLLDVSRISRGKVELKRELVALQVAVQHAVETASPLIEARKHVLATRVPDQPIWVDGDLTRLAQVVGNLLNNATKYTPEGGHIDLEVTTEHGQAVVRVRDDGVGIAPELLPAVFDLFAQAARERGRAQGGLGIGLFLVRRLVELHGGTIAAESPGLGRGTTVTVRFPLAAVREQSAVRPPSGGPDAAPPGRRILVVDDNEDAAEMLAMVLGLHGYDTRVANDGPSALEVAREFSPEVALLDIGLPGMSGHELARKLRADPALAGTVLIALTGWGGSEDKRRSAEAGFDYHLTKPVDIAAVEAVLARSRPHAGTEPTSPQC